LKNWVILLGLTVAIANVANAGVDATYSVRFESDWSSATHPPALPPNSHFSPLIGATHNPSVFVWSPGVLASAGVQQMAETGDSSVLSNEVNDLISAGLADQVVTGPSMSSTPMTVQINSLSVAEEFSLLSLVTMIAPSPDWFVGVHDVALIRDAAWVTSLSLDLHAYDAGTDNGTTFTAPNAPSNPRVPVALSSDAPFDNGVPLGRFVITLVTSSGPPDRLFSDSLE